MEVEIWSDVVCPWCYIGKRRFEAALARFPHAEEVTVHWRSFELDADAPAERPGGLSVWLSTKFGVSVEQVRAMDDRVSAVAAGEGLEYHLESARPGSSFDAHRLIHLAAARGRQDEMKERILAAYFTEGRAVGDRQTLAELAVEIGLDPVEVRAVLDGDDYGAAVREDEARARSLGFGGVPTFVVAGRYAASGAQEADVLLALLQRAWDETHDAEVGATRAR